MLIEVLVSAVLVAVIGVALFGALNSAAKVSGKSKTRAGAAAVAQDDQERMRAMPVATLNNFRDHRDPVVMGKIAYVVDSRAEWIADAKGATDCTANGAAADYLKITSTVSAKNIPLKPVVVTSTVTPGARHLHERRGQPRGVDRRRRRHRVAPASTCRSTARPTTSSSPTPTAAPSSATSPSATTTSRPPPRATSTPTATRPPRARRRWAARRSPPCRSATTRRGRRRRTSRPRRTTTTTPQVDTNAGLAGLLQRRRHHQQRRALLRQRDAGHGDHDAADAVSVPRRLQRVRGRLRQQRRAHRRHARLRSSLPPGKLDHTVDVHVPALNLVDAGQRRRHARA